MAETYEDSGARGTELSAASDTEQPLRLTEWTSCGGCAAKWGGAPLSALVRGLAATSDRALLVGLAPFDDAAVHRLSDGTVLPVPFDPEDVRRDRRRRQGFWWQ